MKLFCMYTVVVLIAVSTLVWFSCDEHLPSWQVSACWQSVVLSHETFMQRFVVRRVDFNTVSLHVYKGLVY